MPKSKNKKVWIKRHLKDEFVRKSVKEGFRSRAAYKLLEIQEKSQVIKKGQIVVDLGAAPGGWLQVVESIVGKGGKVVGLDVLEIEPLRNVTTIKGDLLQNETLKELRLILGSRQADLVISDMAPNISGISSVDQPKSMFLCDLALDFCRQELRKGGSFVVKAFQGEGFDIFLNELKNSFGKVNSRKPKASRPKSREVYLVAENFLV
tara:strand:- start:5640 stop:6260 length:621 start_codon:yes stop_codon:yes gene_type:complete